MSIKIESCRNSMEIPFAQSKALLPMVENPQSYVQNDVNEDSVISAVESRTCTECRKSKVKCDKQDPCNRCTRLNLACIAQKRGRGRPSMPKSSSAGRKNYVKTSIQRSIKSEDEEVELELRPKRKRDSKKSFTNHQSVVTPDSDDINTSHYLSPNTNRSSPQQVIFTSSTNETNIRDNKLFSTTNNNNNNQSLKLHCKPYDSCSYLMGEFNPHRKGRLNPSASKIATLPLMRNNCLDMPAKMHQMPNVGHGCSRPMNRSQDYQNQTALSWSNVGDFVQLTEPTDLIVNSFWKLNNSSEISRSKSLVVIRHWVQVALNRHSMALLSKSMDMGQSLGFEFNQIIDDVELRNRLQDLAKNAERYNNAPSSIMNGPLEITFPEHIQALSSNLCAVSQRLVVRGRSRFVNNEMWSKLFMSSEQANKVYSENSFDVWGSIIHPNDHFEFFDGIANQLFRVPCLKSDCQFLLFCVDSGGASFPALIRFRSCFLEGGDVAAFALTVDMVPHSRYVQMTPPTLPQTQQPIPIINPCTFENMYNMSLPHQHDGGSAHNIQMSLTKSGTRKEMQDNGNKANPGKFRRNDPQQKFDGAMFPSVQASSVKEDFGALVANSSYLGHDHYSLPEHNLTKEVGYNIEAYDPSSVLPSSLLNVGDLSRFSAQSPFGSNSTGDMDGGMEDVVLNDILNITQADYAQLGSFKSGGLDGSDLPCLTFETMMRDSA